MYVHNLARWVGPGEIRAAALTARLRVAATTLARFLVPARWLAAAVVTVVALRLAGGGEAAMLALAATSSLVYVGTAVLSGRVVFALLDLATAGFIVALAFSGVDPATVLVGHALWGAVRGSLGAQGLGSRFAAGWSVFFAALALLFGISG
jgi:hypothetical protein